MCSRKRFQMVAEGQSKRIFAEGVDINPEKVEEIPDHGCWENLSAAVKTWNISADDVPSPFNIFQCMRIDPDTGIMYDTMIRPNDEARVDFRAEMGLLVAASACPESGRGQAIRVEIYDDRELGFGIDRKERKRRKNAGAGFKPAPAAIAAATFVITPTLRR